MSLYIRKTPDGLGGGPSGVAHAVSGDDDASPVGFPVKPGLPRGDGANPDAVKLQGYLCHKKYEMRIKKWKQLDRCLFASIYNWDHVSLKMMILHQGWQKLPVQKTAWDGQTDILARGSLPNPVKPDTGQLFPRLLQRS